MKAYVLAVAGAVLVSALLSVIVPGGKTGKFIKGMAKLFVLSVLISPVLSLVKGEYKLGEAGSSALDDGYLSHCASLIEEEDSERISFLLKEKFSLETEVISKRNALDFTLEKITVKLSEPVISGQDGHIDIVTDVQAFLRETFGCETEVI